MENNDLNYSVSFEEKLKDFTNKAMSIAPIICAVGIAIWWIFYGMVEIQEVEIGWNERIGVALCSCAMAISYCKLIAHGGFQSAKSTKSYSTLTNRWSADIKAGTPYKQQIIEYAKNIALNNLKAIRKENLENYGVLYNTIFDDDGNLINLNYRKNKYHKKKNPLGFTLKQRNAIRKCVEMNVVIPEMFGNISGKFFGIKKRKTQKAYEIQTDAINNTIRVIVASVSTGFMIGFLGFSLGSMIYALFQIVLWSASGIVQRLKNYNFVIRELQPQILENCLIIEGYLETHPQVPKNEQETENKPERTTQDE